MPDITLQDVRTKYPQYADLPDDQLAQGLHQKFYHDMPFEQFSQKIGYAQKPAAREPASFGHTLLGEGELAGAGAVNAIPAAGNALIDLVSRATGFGPRKDTIPSMPVGQAGKDLVSDVSELPPAQAASGALHAADTKLGEISPTLQDVVHQAGSVAGDLGALLPVGGGAKGVASKFLTGTEDAAAQAGAGFRSGAGQGIARTIAGDSGKKALQSHNQQIGNAVAAGEANHAGEAPLSYEATQAARKGPDDVYTRVGANLPEGQIDEPASAAVGQAGSGTKLVTASQSAQDQIAGIKSQLLNKSFTGDQLVNNLRSLRQEGFKRVGSEDVDQQAVGHAQLDMARAVEGHIERNLPQGGDVTVGDFRDARKTLAKNHAVESALHGPDVDLKAIARMQRADPQLLDGGLKDIADFANGPGRNVVGLPDSYNQPSVAGDVADAIDLHNPLRGVAKFLGGAKARSALTGDTAAAVDAARARYGVDPNRFNPRPGLTPPPGRAGRDPTQLGLGDLPQGPGPAPWSLGEGANPNPTMPGGGQGQLSLADLLSHGVEKGPSPGLSAGPMGAPAPQGIPFQQNVGHLAGDLGLADNVPLADKVADNRDLGSVMSEGHSPGGPSTPTSTREPQLAQEPGVPTGTATRAAKEPAVTHEVDEDTGAHVAKSQNGETHGQESGRYLIVKRTDTAKGAQGGGEGTARMETLIQQAEHRGLTLGSDVSVSPAQVKVYQRLERMGYHVTKNDFEKSATTGNLVSKDPRKPVFEVSSPLAKAVGQ